MPKRGAEVGGVLLGTIERGNPSIVRIENFESVECRHKHGPSYLLTDDEEEIFDDACERWRPNSSRPVYAVGLFRSQTREGFSLSAEDIQLMDRYLPSATNVVLLVKPFGTKVSTGGFFFRENSAFQSSSPLEFPFRRREVGGEEAPPRRPMIERRPPPDRSIPPPAATPTVTPPPPKSRLRSGWVWIPLSFVFLLLGVLLGFQAALTMNPAGGQDFSLGLSVLKADDNLSVKWNPQAAAIHNSQHGVLEIEDGTYTKSLDLDTAQLQNGSILYRNASRTVRFRLIVYPKARVSVVETFEWKVVGSR